MTLTHGELFAGIGGFGLAFGRAHVPTLWAVEIDADCRKVLRHHAPDMLLLEDVRTVGAHNLPPVDIISFGSPCQDLSVAGRRAGFDGARSGLFHEAVRIVRELRPRYAIWENVPGALSSHGGRDFGVALDALADAGAVDICWSVLDAQFFGVPQRRRRVFVVASFSDGDSAAKVLLEPEGGGRDTAPRRAAGQGTARGAQNGAGSGGGEPFTLDWQAGASGDTSWRGKARSWIVDKPGRSRALTANHQLAVALPGVGELAHALTAEGHDASEPSAAAKDKDGTGRGTPLVPMTIGLGSDPLHATELAQPITGRNGDPGVVAFTQNQRDEVRDLGGLSGEGAAQPGMKQQTYVAQAVAFTERTREGGRNVESQEELAYALNNPGEGGRTQENRVVTPTMAVRRLLPIECCRLMGFPDTWLDGLQLSDSTKYRQLGNSVAVPVVAWIARRLVAAASTTRRAVAPPAGREGGRG